MNLFPRLQILVARTLKIEPTSLHVESSSDDFPAQWDSMGQVNLIMALEEEFGIYVEPEDFGVLNSVPSIMALLEREGLR